MGNRFSSKGLSWLILIVLWFPGTSCSSADDSSHQEHSPPTQGGNAPEPASVVEIPQEYQPGAERFQRFCSRCHGLQGAGTDHGPPLVHKIYEPAHHGDFAFFRAAAQGVRAHHWKFGDMPNIADATEKDVQEIVKYVRWLQRQAGIY